MLSSSALRSFWLLSLGDAECAGSCSIEPRRLAAPPGAMPGLRTASQAQAGPRPRPRGARHAPSCPALTPMARHKNGRAPPCPSPPSPNGGMWPPPPLAGFVPAASPMTLAPLALLVSACSNNNILLHACIPICSQILPRDTTWNHALSPSNPDALPETSRVTYETMIMTTNW
jgi:hypothetical protein